MYAGFLGENPTLETAAKHILHFLELDSDGTHIALGWDLDGCDALPDGVFGVQSYCALADYLLSNGVGESIVYNIFWNNALGVISHAVCNHKK